MKFTKRILPLLLASAMLTFALAGCSGRGDTEIGIEATTKGETSTQAPATEKATETTPETEPGTEQESETETATETDSESDSFHTHEFGEWMTVTEPTCMKLGLRERVCACGKKEIEEISMTKHNYVDNVCAICGKKEGGGLEYTEDGNGGYKVSGIGTCTDLDIVIPSECNGKPVTSIGGSAFFWCGNLTSITIPDSVTIIGDEAFYGCHSLTSITIPGSVTVIGEYAFSGCSGLTSVYITDIVAWCNISFSNDDSNPLYYAHHLYINRELVTELTIPDSVTSIDRQAFRGCSSLTSITIPDSVTSIEDGAFSGCSSLTSIILPFVGDKVHSATDTYQYPFGYIFGRSSYTGGTATTQHYYGSSTSDTTWSTYYIPSSLKSVTITGGLINYGAFHGCSNLISITISDSVTSIGERAFFWCNNLTNITIPDSVTSVGEEAFSGCSKLIEVCNLSSLTITAGSEDNGYVGYYAKNVYTDATVKSKLWTDENGYTFYEDGNICYLMGYTGNETALTLPPNCNGKNYEIYKYAFYQYGDLTSITIPDSVTGIGYSAFYECSSLTSITIPDSVTSIGENTFMYCSSFTSITIPNGVTSIGSQAFCFCSSLASITIPDSVTSIGEGAFRGCNNLTEITFAGTQAQWNAISKGNYWNNGTGSYVIHCTDGDISK